jgi:hypothetical protein
MMKDVMSDMAGEAHRRPDRSGTEQTENIQGDAAKPEFATFRPVYLEVASRDQSLRFWRNAVGLNVLSASESVELGYRCRDAGGLAPRIAPIDHTMSKAIYLTDSDCLGVEITLETPERFGGYNVASRRCALIDAEGRVRAGGEPLDVEVVRSTLRGYQSIGCGQKNRSHAS